MTDKPLTEREFSGGDKQRAQLYRFLKKKHGPAFRPEWMTPQGLEASAREMREQGNK